MLFGQLTGKNRVGEAVFADLNYRVKRWDFFGNLQYAHAAQHERSEEHLAFGKRSVDSRNDANNKMSQLGGAMGFNYTADNGVSAGLKYCLLYTSYLERYRWTDAASIYAAYSEGRDYNRYALRLFFDDCSRRERCV